MSSHFVTRRTRHLRCVELISSCSSIKSEWNGATTQLSLDLLPDLSWCEHFGMTGMIKSQNWTRQWLSCSWLGHRQPMNGSLSASQSIRTTVFPISHNNHSTFLLLKFIIKIMTMAIATCQVPVYGNLASLWVFLNMFQQMFHNKRVDRRRRDSFPLKR